MGGDSLSAIQFLVALEKRLNRRISPNQLFVAPTFSGLVTCLAAEAETLPQQTSRAVEFIQKNTFGWHGRIAVPSGILRSFGNLKNGQPIFWASESIAEVDAILKTLGESRPLFVAGSLRKFRRRTEHDFEVVADQLAREIMMIQPNVAIALGGFCGGAWVMHHTAEALLRLGREIRVFISFDY